MKKMQSFDLIYGFSSYLHFFTDSVIMRSIPMKFMKLKTYTTYRVCTFILHSFITGPHTHTLDTIVGGVRARPPQPLTLRPGVSCQHTHTSGPTPKTHCTNKR